MRLPLGFADFHELRRFTEDLARSRAADGGDGAAHVIGTAATFYSMNLDKPSGHHFDRLGPRTSDVDVVLRSVNLLGKMRAANGEPDGGLVIRGKHVWLRNDGPRGFLTACTALSEFALRWSEMLRRPVDVRLLLAMPDDKMELLDFQPPPIELLPFAGIFPGARSRIRCGEDWSVVVSDAELQLIQPSGELVGLPWDALDAVDIETTAGGPIAADVFWVLGSGDAEALVPQGIRGEDGLVAKLQSLPGFDHEAMIAAMSSTNDRIFACWRRDE